MCHVVEPDLTGTRISHYVVMGVIGAGGTGTVYLGRDEHLRRYVAIKALRPQAPTEDASCQDLLTEARMLSRFSHRYVASIYDFVHDSDREYIVMEFVPGATMKEVIAAGPLPGDEVARLGVQLARGLAAAHAAGVIHRDIKPQNMKITSNGRLKILDFGLAAPVAGWDAADGSRHTTSGRCMAGTVPYMSPEQVRGDDLDERTDIFSAGAVLYEMAAGRPAFPQRHLAQLVEAIQYHDPPALSAVNPFVNRCLERVIATALQKDRERRQRDATVLASELRTLRHAGHPARPATMSLVSSVRTAASG
jgi:eukaryotic-like serine/threonine-protein kinase